jgi:hypothetical protein
LVVVELKRNEDGGHMELQALRYAAMVAAMTFDQAVETLARQRSKLAPDTDAARIDILTHLGWSEPDEESFAAETRIILAAADFGKELITCVLWLRDCGIDIGCVRLKPRTPRGAMPASGKARSQPSSWSAVSCSAHYGRRGTRPPRKRKNCGRMSLSTWNSGVSRRMAERRGSGGRAGIAWDQAFPGRKHEGQWR